MPGADARTELLLTYLRAESVDDAHTLLAGNPSLLTDTSVKVLDVLARSLPGDPELFQRNVRLLTRAIAVGLERAFGEFSGTALPDNLEQLARDYLESAYVSNGARYLQAHQELFATGAEFTLADLVAASEPERRAHRILLFSFYIVARQSDPSSALRQVYEGRGDTYELQAWQWAEGQLEKTADARYLDAAVLFAEGAIAGPAFASLTPAQQAYLLVRAGLVYQRRTQVRAGLEDLNAAIGYFSRSLEIDRESADTRWRLGALGTLWTDHFERTGDVADLHQAVERLQDAVPGDAVGVEPSEVAAATSLANVLRHRYMVSGDASDITRAVSLHERIAAVPADAETRGLRLTNLVSSIMARYERTGDITDLDHAIDLGRQSMADAPAEASWRATGANNLARALQTRFNLTRQVGDLREAIDHFAQALKLGPPHEQGRGATNLGFALMSYYGEEKDERALDQALTMLRHAARLAAAGGAERSRPFAGLLDALLLRFRITGERADVDEAIQMGTMAVDLAAGNLPLLASGLGNLAVALNERFEAFGDVEDRNRATALFRKAAEEGVETAPEATLTASSLWGAMAIKHEAWAEGIEAYRYAFRASEALFASQRDRRTKEERLRHVQGLGARAAYVLTRAGQLQDAVVALERARTLLVADALSQGQQGAGQALTYEQIASAAAGAPVVYIELVANVGFALVVNGAQPPRSVWLPELTERTLRDRLNLLYNEGYYRRQDVPARWQQLLDETTGWLWTSLMEPMLTLLGDHQEAVLIPGDILPLVPLHAAWTEDATRPTGRRHAGDGMIFRYAPSARAMLHTIDATRLPADSVLCVEEPAPTTADPLPNARHEVNAVAAKFPSARVVSRTEAEVDRVAGELVNATVAHFACHAFANPKEPLRGGLVMSGDRVLSLASVFEMRLTRLRLVVLSACETGAMGQVLPDEAISLPTGLLQAGVPGIVASLWSVPDIGTALLMRKFYELWPGPEMTPARALNDAQRWVRDTTNAEKATQLRGTPLFKDLMLRDPGGRDFAASTDWAAFYVTGG